MQTSRPLPSMSLLAVALMLLIAACGGGDDQAADFCKKFRTYEDANEELAERNLENPEAVDLEDLKSTVEKVDGQVQELADEAPDEIADDVATLRDTVSELNKDVQDASDAPQILQAFQEQASNEELERADERVQDWVEDNCDSEGDTKE